jgi:hypothetical protein
MLAGGTFPFQTVPFSITGMLFSGFVGNLTFKQRGVFSFFLPIDG